MSEDHEQILEKALAYDSDTLIRFYLQLKPKWNYYREQYVQLYFEARRCFFNDCPNAAIIVAGEALLRAIFDRIVYLYDESPDSTARSIFYGSGTRKSSLDDLFSDKDYTHYDLVDKFSFDEGIKILEQSNLYSRLLLSKMYDIKALRNIVVHKGFALIDWWDIDICQTREDFVALLKHDLELPEAYRILKGSRNKSNWIYFDCRAYNCTMKELSSEERVAAIQLQLVQEIIKGFSKGEVDEERYQNRDLA
jgi:hypothetical protein